MARVTSAGKVRSATVARRGRSLDLTTSLTQRTNGLLRSCQRCERMGTVVDADTNPLDVNGRGETEDAAMFAERDSLADAVADGDVVGLGILAEVEAEVEVPVVRRLAARRSTPRDSPSPGGGTF